MNEIPARYTPQEVEDKWGQSWEENNIFHAQYNKDKKPYSIVIPPPNVTGILHMGHALNNTLQDIIIRYKRMKGFETLWMPGTDHAGIATQNVVEKQLAKEGKTRHDISREDFLDRLWAWKKQYGDTIIHQLKKLGSSCDWERTRFTMDGSYSKSVNTVFVKLYKKGLIYRGQYIINWCPRCHTALSDEEAEHQDTQGSLYHIQYPFKDNPNQYVTVATTRPETMLGDTAVAVNPKDKRYKNLIGKILILPLMNREIKIIADDFVDPTFGTGAVKVTPAHDPNDFNMGKRHNLEFINILNADATLNENTKEFKNLDRFEARKIIIEKLKQQNLLVKIDQHQHAVGHCYRCHTVVEPYLSKQWFVKMKPLAKPALDVVKKGKVKFYPDRWTKVYVNWMEGIRDWCISRQIWWGHRIPVWYCKSCGDEKFIVSEETPKCCPECKKEDLYQDPDVLDTWFSSWLWPFATLGWPEKNDDLKYFYPTKSLFTAPEIIFFWVARMIMAGLEFMGDIPFSDVYLHGTVRDAEGKKMSKSLGNAIDPLEIIKEYGADALRFSLIMNSGQDLFISKEKFEIGRNFANKIWNASRLIFMNTADLNTAHLDQDFADIKKEDLVMPCQWILSRMQITLLELEDAIEKYKFSEAENIIYDFIWKNFCDWYLEMIKNNFENKNVKVVTLFVLEQILRMIHPFMPFVSEEIWHNIHPEDKSLAKQSWPKTNKKLINTSIESDMKNIFDLIVSVRNVRAQWRIQPSTKSDCVLIGTNKILKSFKENAEIIRSLSSIENLKFGNDFSSKDAAAGISGEIKFYIPLSGIIDIGREKNRIKEQLFQSQSALKGLSARLKNKDFLKKAPKDVIEKETVRLKEITNNISELTSIIKDLS
ncbi:MAG: valine--tRNA ligase [Candidatus Omnitrophica bacterium]|nr:valine--tRNA ligase [Candidatus Omnitrophota bacterium]